MGCGWRRLTLGQFFRQHIDYRLLGRNKHATAHCSGTGHCVYLAIMVDCLAEKQRPNTHVGWQKRETSKIRILPIHLPALHYIGRVKSSQELRLKRWCFFAAADQVISTADDALGGASCMNTTACLLPFQHEHCYSCKAVGMGGSLVSASAEQLRRRDVHPALENDAGKGKVRRKDWRDDEMGWEVDGCLVGGLACRTRARS